MSIGRTLQRHRRVLLVCVVVQATLGVLATRAWLANHNTLQANGRWVSTKTTLDRGLLGAFSYVTTLNALAGGRLHLDAWHGYNEVVLTEALDRPRTIEFDLELGENAWIVAGFNRGDDGAYDAVRLSTLPSRPSSFLRVSPEGAFLAREPLETRSFGPPAELRVRLELADHSVRVLVDGELEGEFAATRRGRERLSFRGNAFPAAVDNVKVRSTEGTLIETFDAPPASSWLTAATVLGVLALNGMLFLALCGIFGVDDRFLAFRLLMIDLTLLVLGAVVYVYVVRGAAWYPRLNEVMAQSEAYFRKGELDNVLAEIEARHRGPSVGSSRILFIGSSQTWGAGAGDEREVWVRVLEDEINRDARSPAVECINAGVSSTRARDFVSLMPRLLAYEPRLVVINLSSNDRVNSFVRPIRALVKASLDAGARVVLVKEANAPSLADRGLEARHRELERLAGELEVGLIDMHSFLARQDERGLLWWDKVHLTTFGQLLLAREMTRRLEDLGLLDPQTAGRSGQAMEAAGLSAPSGARATDRAEEAVRR